MPYESISRQFFHFDRWLGAQPVGNGHINDTYRIDFEARAIPRSFLLQRLNHHIFRQPQVLMENIRKVSDHLSRQEYPYQLIHPVTTLDGQLLYTDPEGNYWRVFPFIQNSYAPEALVQPEIAWEAARAYGAFARAMRSFPAIELAETIPGFHDTDRRWEVFTGIVEKNPAQRVQQSSPEIAAMQEALPVFEAVSRMKKSGELPLRVTHNDTKAGNVLFDQNTHKALAVIDLDTVMPGAVLSDFGDMVRTFAPDKTEDNPTAVSLRQDMIAALLEGFLLETGDWLHAAERKHLMLGAAWITGEQALRFLTDWLAGDVYYKIQYPEHNLIRARNQLALFRLILAEVV
ncbi:MAG: aminoglycoside phosphotransferase family protein [Saprospiraceae bacterium]|nr:aminoglycoside phosphotransferase family protein [Saprospiraceae bacterium]